MGMTTGDVIVYDDLKIKIIQDLYNFCSKQCVNVGEAMSQDDILNRVSSNPSVRKCFDPRLNSYSNCIYGPFENGGSKTAYLEKPNFTNNSCVTGSIVYPHVLPGSDVGFRQLSYVISSSENDLLSKSYNMNAVKESINTFLWNFQVDLKDHIITTKDMIHFFCCMLTFVQHKIIKVSGGCTFTNFKITPKMAYYFHDCSNEGITVNSIDNISEREFGNIDNVMNLFNSKMNTHHIKYELIETKI